MGILAFAAERPKLVDRRRKRKDASWDKAVVPVALFERRLSAKADIPGLQGCHFRRLVDVFVDALNLAELGIEGVAPASTGRTSYHPSALLKL